MRALLVAVCLIGLASGARAADDGPAAVIQTLPLGKMLNDIRAASMLVADELGPKAIDDGLKQALGEKGFLGLDLTKPILGYQVFDAKHADKPIVIVLIPITKEDEFIDFLQRCHVNPSAVEGKPGLYKLANFELPGAADAAKAEVMETLMRVSGTMAYVGVNATAEMLDPAKAYKPEQIHDAKSNAFFSYKLITERMPAEAVKAQFESYQAMLKQLKEATGGDEAKVLHDALEKLIQMLTKMGMESKEMGTQVTLDTTSGEFAIDSYYTPKAGTDFAKLVAARKPTENQFAGLAGETTAGGVMVQLPVGIKEMQDLMVVGLEKLQQKAKDEPPPTGKELLDESLKGAIRTVKGGTWDIALTLNGPDKDGHFVAAFGMTFDNATLLEKPFKETTKDFPAEMRDGIKFDVDKIGEINIHSFDPPERGEPAGYVRMFGDRKIYFAFGPKGIYAALGNGAKDSLKIAIAGKAGPSNPFDILANPKRIGQAITTFDAGVGAQAEKIFGNEDKTYSAYTIRLSGGDSLRMKFSVNLKILPRFMFQMFAMRN